jgi:hypothetical protein
MRRDRAPSPKEVAQMTAARRLALVSLLLALVSLILALTTPIPLGAAPAPCTRTPLARHTAEPWRGASRGAGRTWNVPFDARSVRRP